MDISRISISVAQVKKKPADGYTLLMVATTSASPNA